MFSRFLVRTFIKNYNNIENEKVRKSYGYLAGIVGALSNIILFIIKLSIGILCKSIAVTADAFNNLSDAASSIITIFSFKLANKPPDKEHPFGHGRIEYIAALIVSFMVLLVGFKFIQSSFDRIINPQNVIFQLTPFILLVLSILVKVWLAFFNKFIGKTINSSTLEATSLDSISDVATSSCVAISLILCNWVSFPIDGYIGILVSLFILYSGYSLIKDTLNPLLGEMPDPEIVQKIKEEILKYPYITGVHDLIIHNYGPGKCMASIHAEVPCDISIIKIHEVIDKAERIVSKKLNIFLVIHMDPINTNDEEVRLTEKDLLNVLKKFPIVKSLHDFRIIGEGENKNLVFDIVISFNEKFNEEQQEELKSNIDKEMKKFHPHYNTIITIDRDFIN